MKRKRSPCDLEDGDITKKRKKAKYPDIKFIFPDGLFIETNRNLFVNASPVFEAIFESNENVIELNEKYEDIKLLISFLEPFSDAEVDQNNIKTITYLAHKYLIDVLIKKCEDRYAYACYKKNI